MFKYCKNTEKNRLFTNGFMTEESTGNLSMSVFSGGRSLRKGCQPVVY